MIPEKIKKVGVIQLSPKPLERTMETLWELYGHYGRTTHCNIHLVPTGFDLIVVINIYIIPALFNNLFTWPPGGTGECEIIQAFLPVGHTQFPGNVLRHAMFTQVRSVVGDHGPPVMLT